MLRKTTAIFAITILVLAAGTSRAQGLPSATQGMVQDYQQVISAYESAQASARRPGDEQLGCAALKTELEAIVKDPAFQAYFETAGAAAQRDFAFVQGQQAAMMAGVPAASLQAPPLSATERAAEQAKQMEVLTTLMPKMLRAQRVNELAMLQACDWLTDGGLAMPGMAEPDASQE